MPTVGYPALSIVLELRNAVVNIFYLITIYYPRTSLKALYFYTYRYLD